VTGVDLAPALIETARQRAQEQKFEIDYLVGDCKRLDLDDAFYDRLSSTCGIMFAPDHAATAHELRASLYPAAGSPLRTGRRTAPGPDVQDDEAIHADAAAGPRHGGLAAVSDVRRASN
jgi:SAM-dependent methyltransferase